MSARENSYSVSEAAHVLALSPRRVRQYVHDGRLPAERDPSGAFRISKQAVHALRERRVRSSGGRAPRTREAGPEPNADLDSFLARVVTPLERALEEQGRLAARTEQLLREQLAEERTRLKAAELRIQELEEQLGVTTDEPREDVSELPSEGLELDEPEPSPRRSTRNEARPARSGEDFSPEESETTVRIIGPERAGPEPSLPPYEPNLESPGRPRKGDDASETEDKGPFSLLKRLRETS